MNKDLDIKFELFTGSSLVCDNPCLVYAVLIIESGTTHKKLTLRNGFDSSGEIKMIVSASVYHCPAIIFNQPVRFSKGLYIVFDTGLEYAMIQYKIDY